MSKQRKRQVSRRTILRTSAVLAGVGATSGVGSATAAEGGDGLAGLDPVMHLAADELDASDGDQIGTWTDSTEYGNDATQDSSDAQPTYRTDEIAGQPALNFDGEDDRLRLHSEMISLDDFTLFVVGQWDSETNVMLDGYSPETDAEDRLRIANFDVGATLFSYQLGGKQWWQTNVIGKADTNPHIFGLRSEADGQSEGTHTVTPYLDGDNIPDYNYGALHHSADSNPGAFTLGGGYVPDDEFGADDGVPTGDRFYDGTIAEVILFDEQISDDDVAQVNAYLTEKYDQFSYTVPDDVNKPLQLGEDELDYEGRDESAAWRSAAQSRIDEHRKGDLDVSVVDAEGNPVEGTTVDVSMQSHAFNWGTSVLEGKLTGDAPDDRRYKQAVGDKFNYATFENGMKVYNWEGDAERQAAIDESITWLNDIGHDIRGHAAFWEVWWWMNMGEWSDDYYEDLTDEEIDRTVQDKIQARLAEYAGRLDDWDTQNHPFHRQQIRRYISDSRDEELEYVSGWWDAARTAAPTADHGINEQNIVLRYPDSNHMPEYLDWIRDLKDADKPGGAVQVDDIGFMGHSPIDNLQDIPDVLDRIDTFQSEFPESSLYVSEFHVPLWQAYEDWDNATDAMKEAQADYVRDFLTAAFSKQNVETVVYWDMWAGASWRSTSAFYEQDWSIRPHGQVYLDLVFDEWWTDETGEADGDGRYATRGFRGEYQVAAIDGDLFGRVTTTLDANESVEVTLAPVSVASLDLSLGAHALASGESTAIDLALTAEDGTDLPVLEEFVSYESSDTDVVQVDGTGTVSVTGEGTATVTATVSGYGDTAVASARVAAGGAQGPDVPTGPEIVVDGLVSGGEYWGSVDPTITVEDDDAVDETEFTLDGEAYDEGEIVERGEHALTVSATDAAGVTTETTVAFAIHHETALELVDTQGQQGPTGYEATLTDAATDDPLADREVVMSSDGETLHTGQTAADGTLFVKRGTLFGDNPPEGDSFTLTATFDADEDPHLAAVETTEEFTSGNGNGK